ncbi:MAG: LysR family transcriptional regulator [Parasporobacterium sp.]|nr:LysR family transcriptional regulator [Parasporobacterium sp.]
MTIREMQWMLQLFQTKNMKKAAETLYVSQPALSQCLHRLEKELGFPLFIRTYRGLEPTKQGMLFQETCEQILSAYENFMTKTALLDKETLSSVVIGLPPYQSSIISAPLIQVLQKKYPTICFSVRESFHEELVQGLRQNKLQLFISNGSKEQDKEFQYHDFGYFMDAICLRTGSPHNKDTFVQNGIHYIDPYVLSDEAWAVTRKGQDSRNRMDLLFEFLGLTPVIVQETHLIATLHELAVRGIACSIIPYMHSLVEKTHSEENIYFIPENYKIPKNKRYIVCLKETEKHLPGDFLEFLGATLRKIEL